jgi:cell division protease FtsH
MATEPWLPIGFMLPGGARVGAPAAGGPDWQIVGIPPNGRALIVTEWLACRWRGAGLITGDILTDFSFGDRALACLSCDDRHVLCAVAEARQPGDKTEALSFALALKATRDIDPASALQDALYVEKFSRLLPTYTISSRTGDDIVLGYWLTGGTSISARAFRRLHQAISWLGPGHLRDVVRAAGLEVTDLRGQPVGRPGDRPADRPAGAATDRSEPRPQTPDGHAATGAGPPGPGVPDAGAEPAADRPFELPGRPELAAFFNEHVIDIINNRERYSALGIDFPSAVVLHGPPGTGKTYAVGRLIEYLGWPSFHIEAASIASPYIHETSRKVAAVFEKAIEAAPSVLVIDEMEAFLADRDAGEARHRVEEVAEFLRRIPEATRSGVLIVAMTNRLEMIDPAILRRGRFDHLIKVDFAGEEEVRGLLDALLGALPRAPDVDAAPLARALRERPLSDVAFVVREAARLAARAGAHRIDQQSLTAALQAAPARDREGGDTGRRIGFI